MSNAARAEELLVQCEALQHGTAQVVTAQEAVRQADLSGELDLQIRARSALITAATFAGRAELSLVAFSWNVAHFDDQELRDDDLWYQFQWLAEDTSVMLAVTRDNVEHVISEMDRVYQLNNWWHYPVDLAHFRSSVVFGATRQELAPMFEHVVREIGRVQRHSRYLNHVLGAAYLSIGHHKRGIEVIARNFDDSLPEESEYPTRCHCIIVLPLLALGRHDEAAHHFRLGMRMAASNPVYLREIAGLVAYAGLTRDAPTLARLLERHLGWAITNFDRWSSMRLYLCAAWSLERVVETALPIRLPESAPGWRDDGCYAPRALAAALKGEGIALAREFDARHGNDAWVRRASALELSEDPRSFLTPD